MNRKMKVLATLPSVVILSVALIACGPPPPSPPGLIPPVTVVACAEEPGDQTPKVMEFMWLYPQQLTPPQPGCKLSDPSLQVDVWISLGEGQIVVALLCGNLLHGIMKGPIGPGAVWGVCMAVQPQVLGLL